MAPIVLFTRICLTRNYTCQDASRYIIGIFTPDFRAKSIASG
jgi:hypothetical protein